MKHRDLERLTTRLTTLLLVMALLLVIAGSLIPLHFAKSWAEIEAALRAGVTLSELNLLPIKALDFSTVTERLFAFVPLGFLFHQKLVQHQWQGARVIAFILIIVLALMIEFAQAALSIRHPRISDFILAIAAGGVGISFSIPIHQLLIQPLRDTIYGVLPGVLVLGNYIVTCVLVAVIVPASTELRGWDCSYPLLVGNELTYDRPWYGKIRGLAFYSRELTADEIRRLSQVSLTPENAPLRKAMNVLSLYSFATTEHNRVSPLGNASPSTALIIEEREAEGWQLEEGILHLRKPTLVESAGPVDAICNAILASQAFTVETEIASDDLTQGGPARILSNSVDAGHRNFTLGEREGDLVLRVRTPQNGINGSNIELQTKGDILAGGWHHVIASYGDGTAKLFVDGKEAAPPLHYEKFLFLGTILTAHTAFLTGFLLLAMGVVASIIFYFRALPETLLKVIGSTGLIPFVFVFIIAAWLGRHPSPIFFGAIVFVPLLGFALGWEWKRRFVRTE